MLPSDKKDRNVRFITRVLLGVKLLLEYIVSYIKTAYLPVMSSIITIHRLLLASPNVILSLIGGVDFSFSVVTVFAAVVSCSQIAWINSRAYSVTSGLVVCLKMWQRAVGRSSDFNKYGYEDSSSARQFKNDKQLLNTASFVFVSVIVSATTSIKPSLPSNQDLNLH